MTAAGHDYEIILGDDGSTDASPDRLAMLGAVHDNVRCITSAGILQAARWSRYAGETAIVIHGFD